MNIHKLVRDKIPDLIIQRGAKPIIQTLDPASYQQELRHKLSEEVSEFFESGQIEELVDILEVVFTLATSQGISQTELEERRLHKLSERGGFSKGILLVKIIEQQSKDPKHV